jgi:hypothetical protein
MGTLGHQGIFVIAIYFFLLIIAHYRLPSVQNKIKAEHKAKQNELKKRLGQLKKWEGALRAKRKPAKRSASKKKTKRRKR